MILGNCTSFWWMLVAFLTSSSLIWNSTRYLCLGKLMNIIIASLLNSWQHPWAQYHAVLSIFDIYFNWKTDLCKSNSSLLPNLIFSWVHDTKACDFSVHSSHRFRQYRPISVLSIMQHGLSPLGFLWSPTFSPCFTFDVFVHSSTAFHTSA